MNVTLPLTAITIVIELDPTQTHPTTQAAETLRRVADALDKQTLATFKRRVFHKTVVTVDEWR